MTTASATRDTEINDIISRLYTSTPWNEGTIKSRLYEEARRGFGEGYGSDADREERLWGEVHKALLVAIDKGISPLIVGGSDRTTRLENSELPYYPLLWVRGDLGALDHLKRSVALVGARAATGYGEHVAMELAAGLGAHERTVISGGAYGIDGMAHRAALASQSRTIGVLAGGLDRLYPSGHEALLERIASTPGSALVSTEMPGCPPTKFRFLARNGIIAALASAVVVVEAGNRSGSLNTAGWAQKMGRPLGAVPGPITSAASSGTNRLLDGTAKPITSVGDIIAMFNEGVS